MARILWLFPVWLAFGCGLVACGDDSSGAGDAGNADTDADSDTDSDTDSDSDSDGCGQSPDGIATSIDVGGDERTFALHIPKDYDPEFNYPLIFAWHGLGGSGDVAQNYFGIEQHAGDDAIIVYPDALYLDEYDATGWEVNPNGYDFNFFDALYDHLLGNLCIDASRVFSTGHSFGGYMTNYLGCYRADVFNAIAPVAGGPPWGSCGGPVAAWITHGSADDVVELSEGEAAREKWLTQNDCGDTSSATDPDPCVAYEGCTRDVHWCLHTGGHEWPAFAGAAIWDFFQAQ